MQAYNFQLMKNKNCIKFKKLQSLPINKNKTKRNKYSSDLKWNIFQVIR